METRQVLALQAFQNGGVPESGSPSGLLESGPRSYGYTSGEGYFPVPRTWRASWPAKVIFGLNGQGASLLEPPPASKTLSYSLLGRRELT